MRFKELKGVNDYKKINKQETDEKINYVENRVVDYKNIIDQLTQLLDSQRKELKYYQENYDIIVLEKGKEFVDNYIENLKMYIDSNEKCINFYLQLDSKLSFNELIEEKPEGRSR